MLARDGTGRAERVAAPLAAIAILVVDEITTIIAKHAVPLVEFDVRAAPAVGVEHQGHECNEVVNSSASQGTGNRRASFSLTESLILDVRMGHLFIASGRMRIQRDHTIGLF